MRNALFGYTYQHSVAFLLLVKMDVEREIEKMTLEAVVSHQFDDISIEAGATNYYLQIKDFKNIDVSSLAIANNKVSINGTWHRLSAQINIIFFKEIAYTANCSILGFPAYEFSGVYVVSLNRLEIDKRIAKLYQKDLHRKAVMEQFFADQMDRRIMEFEKFKLPVISVYNTKLIERSVKVSRRLLEFKDLLFIEGNPGIGKSHFVSVLQGQFKDHTLYRFWVSNQDADYEDRLKYANFLTDLSKKLFGDFKDRDENELFAALKQHGTTLIIDGLDHVENYNKKDLPNFLDFIERVQAYCKTIVLSRPLQVKISWKKQTLTNWNERQTQKVLDDLYHIDDYSTASSIYEITGGYPLMVSYVAQQFKIDGQIPVAERFDSMNSYYQHLLKDEKGKQALSVFLCCRSFLMRSELKLFLADQALAFVEEFIVEHPYIFELRLNRVSLFHDSLNTYLRKSGISYTALQHNVNQEVYTSLLKGDKRFQSRVGHFDLSIEQNKAVIKWYASINNFKAVMAGVVDFEAIREFYQQLRNMLTALSPEDLEVIEYYDLALIINITERDHVSTSKEFQYTYTQSLIFNGYTEEDITSKKYLFAMWYYVKINDASLLLNATSDDLYDTKDFHRSLEDDLSKEKTFFEFQEDAFQVSQVKKALGETNSTNYLRYLGYILVNLYLHEANRRAFPHLYEAIKTFMDGQNRNGIRLLINAATNPVVNDIQASILLNEAKKELLAYGIEPERNEYLNLTLKAYINKHGKDSSFTLSQEILSYLRLSLHHKKKIDIDSISTFWTKYYQRKDYTLYSLDMALTVFEQKKWVAWQTSVRLITEIQEVSEKGYRDLLAKYIMAHEPAFILLLLEEFEIRELRISWFDLDPKYLDILPIQIYELEIHDIFSHSYNRGIAVDDIRNLLTSNKLHRFQKDVQGYSFHISVKEGDDIIPLLDQLKISYRTQKPDDDYGIKDDPEKRFDSGVLDLRNVYLIKKRKLSPGEVAFMADGNRTALAEPELFKEFSKTRIKKDFKEILFQGLTGKSPHSNYYHLTWVMPGTILQIMQDNDIKIPNALFKSFKSYLHLSLYELDK